MLNGLLLESHQINSNVFDASVLNKGIEQFTYSNWASFSVPKINYNGSAEQTNESQLISTNKSITNTNQFWAILLN